jgi:hypothetical protein
LPGNNSEFGAVLGASFPTGSPRKNAPEARFGLAQSREAIAELLGWEAQV